MFLLGEKLVKKVNELGIILDGLYVYDEFLEDMIWLFKILVIFFYFGIKLVYDYLCNIDDELFKKLVESGGVIYVNVYGFYLIELLSDLECKKVYGELFK